MSAGLTRRLRDRPGELRELRRDIVDGQCPVLLDAAEVAVVLDTSERAVWERFDNLVMAGDRCLIRAAEVRPLLVAMRPAAPIRPPQRRCLVCDDALKPGQRKFCCTVHAEMSLTARVRYREQKLASENPRVSAGVSPTAMGVATGAWGERLMPGVSAPGGASGAVAREAPLP